MPALLRRLNPFAANEYKRLKAKICLRAGWTLSQWDALPDSEKDFWMGYESYRNNEVVKYWDSFINLRNSKGKPMQWFAPEVVQALVKLSEIG